MLKKIYDMNKLIGGKFQLPNFLAECLERFFGLHYLNVVHRQIEADWAAGSQENFFALACKHFNLIYDLSEKQLEHIPKEGPCVIVANHPHGLSDGIMLGDIALKVRSDVRIVVNEFLEAIDGMRPFTITVDVYGGDQAKRANMSAMRELLRWLRAGHCVLVFPSGSVASYSHADRKVIEDAWQTNMIALIRKTQAQTVPLFISGRTSLFLQSLSLLHKPSRGNFLPREIARDGRMRHKIAIAPAIPSSTSAAFGSDQRLCDYLRLRTSLLSYHTISETQASSPCSVSKSSLAEDIHRDILIAELASLPSETLYYESGKTGFQIYIATASQIPQILRQIAIERERSFRAVGEGTGESLDWDSYDQHYRHLFMWDTRAQRLAGAYRMGLGDEIIRSHGVGGFYNSQFFDIDEKMLPVLAQGVEMGRAFLCADYQGLPTSLDTLWMGIGRFLLRHPQYRYLYGTVSVSQSYSSCSRALIHSYLRVHEMQEQYKGWVRAKFPPKQMQLSPCDEQLLATALPDAKILSKLVSEIEQQDAGIPTLLKHYLRLSGKMLAFGVDVDFGNTFDCFVLVDTSKTSTRIMNRYQGISASDT